MTLHQIQFCHLNVKQQLTDSWLVWFWREYWWKILSPSIRFFLGFVHDWCQVSESQSLSSSCCLILHFIVLIKELNPNTVKRQIGYTLNSSSSIYFSFPPVAFLFARCFTPEALFSPKNTQRAETSPAPSVTSIPPKQYRLFPGESKTLERK